MDFGKVFDLDNVFSVLSFTCVLLGSVVVRIEMRLGKVM